MKTTNVKFLVVLLISLFSVKVSAHYIEVKNADGVTIYYNYINNNTELEVSYRGNSRDSYSYEYSGNVVIPESVTYNGKTYSVTSIGYGAFFGCSGLTSVTIPNSVTSIGGSAFNDCSGLTSVTIPNSVTSIESYAFSGCSGLTSITIPNSVTSIEFCAFYGCSGLTGVTIPNSVTSIRESTFEDCRGLTSITIPNSVTSIGIRAFAYCSGLTSVTIPNSVTSIGYAAFYSCNSLKTVYSEIVSPFAINENVFTTQTYAGTLHVPAGTKAKYQQADGWKKFTNIVEPNKFPIPEYVDLGLPSGVCWAKWNMGSSSELDIPNTTYARYGWGDPTGEVDSASPSAYAAYEWNWQSKKDISGTKYDIATVQWGDKWRIPTPTDFTEISESSGYTTWEYGNWADSQGNSYPAWKVTSKKDPTKYIYFPAAGLIKTNGVSDKIRDYAYYWTSVDEGYGVAKFAEIIRDAYMLPAEYGTQMPIRPVYGTPQTSNNITFADANVKAICVANWDTNGDGELSKDEATAVTDLGTRFSKNTNITSFEELQYFVGLTQINKNAFLGCSGLTSVTIPNSVTSIGQSAFQNCSSLTSITIPNSVTSIGDAAFLGCSGLTSVTIPNSVTSIGEWAFYVCSSLTSVTIGNSVTSIGNHAFDGCSGLTSVSIPNSVTSIGNYTFYECSGLTSVTIGNSVTSIGNYAFFSCSGLTSVTIPNSVTSIGDYAFFSCSGLTSVTIPNSVTSIGEGAFQNCSSLTSVTIGNSVTSIGEYAFYGCSGLTSVHINDLASWCGIAFGSSEANPLYYAHHLILNGTELKDLVVPTSVTSIGNYVFRGCSGLTSVTIPNSVASIGRDTFYDCTGLTSVTIPNSVSSIGVASFWGCSSLTSVTIPNSVTSISGSAFAYCNNLKTVYSEIESPFAINEDVFTNQTYAGTLYVPAGTKTKYQQAGGWNKFANIVEPQTIENITFADATVKAICVANWDTNGDGELSKDEAAAVTDLGTVFSNNANITSFDELQYFVGLTQIGENAFDGSSSLKSITIPKSVKTIGYGAFLKCGGLTSIKVDGGNTVYDSRNGCNAIIETTSNKLIVGCQTTIIPNSVTSIGSIAFAYCRGLTSISIPNSVTSIGEGAFETCSGLTSITIPNSVTSIGDYAFINCDKLKTVYSEIESPFAINENVFSEQTYAGTLHVPANTKSKYLQANGWKKFKNIVDPMQEEQTTFTLSIIATGSGSAAYDGTTIRGKKSEFAVDEGTSVTITFTPDDGYRIAYVKLNDVDVSSNITNNSLTVNNISQDTKVEVEFEMIPYVKVVLNGITYNLYKSNNTAEVTASDDTPYAGNIVIPPSIPYEGTVYKVTSIDSYAFFNCNALTSIVIPNNVTTIGSQAFVLCKNLTSVTLPNSLRVIGIAAFGQCSGLTSITIPSSVVRIDNEAFAYCSGLTSVVIPNGVEYIGDDAFYDCRGLTSLVLSSSITYIGEDAFNYCNNLTSVKAEKTTPVVLGKSVFSNAANATLYVPKGSKTAYENADFWKDFKNIVEESTSFSLSITATGNGSAAYNGTTVRGTTRTFDVTEGTTATITFTPDNGYRIKSVKVNGGTVSVTNDQYTISSISANTTISVEFEEIPPTIYTLSITATGNGSAAYDGTTVRGTTRTFDVTEGTTATITFTPDNGYRIKSVKVNGGTVSVTNNQYTVSSISANTTISVEFEEIPPTTYTLSITATGNGSAAYNGTTVRGTTSTFDVTEGTTATITFTPDNGYRIKTVIVNGGTVSVTNNQYTISSISANTTVNVEFEEISPTIYTLSITATGNGSAAYNGTTVRSTTRTFDVTDGTTATITFTPDNGYRIKTVKVNGATVSLANNQYTISSITANTTVEVTFVEIPSGFTGNDLNYTVTSFGERQVKVTGGNYGNVLTVPATVIFQNETWKVAGIENGMLANNSQLAAVIWEPEAVFTAHVSNPNLLLYVKSAGYAPAGIRNVVVDGVANNIVLTDATNGNDFYCPQAFTASRISYTHNYSMATGIGESKGWESIALPFDVAKTVHASKGEIVPYQKWDGTDSKKPFWLMELGASGFVKANAIKANTPYIISMPNHQNYREDYRLNGSITFSAENVRVARTDDVEEARQGDRHFVPNFTNRQGTGVYALNVNSDYVTYTGGLTAGSRFVPNLRTLHPFEAYMTSTATTRMPIVIGDNMATGIAEVPAMMEETVVRVYLPSGQLVVTAEEKHWETVKAQLPAGLYIVNGQKLIVK